MAWWTGGSSWSLGNHVPSFPVQTGKARGKKCLENAGHAGFHVLLFLLLEALAVIYDHLRVLVLVFVFGKCSHSGTNLVYVLPKINLLPQIFESYLSTQG